MLRRVVWRTCTYFEVGSSGVDAYSCRLCREGGAATTNPFGRRNRSSYMSILRLPQLAQASLGGGGWQRNLEVSDFCLSKRVLFHSILCEPRSAVRLSAIVG